MKITAASFLGPRGSFSEEAAQAFFPEELLRPYPTILDCLEATVSGEVDCAVVPIENSIEGSVNLTVDWMGTQQPLSILADLTLPIRQHLLGHEKWPLEEIQRVYSHPQAIAQTRKFLQKELPQAEVIFTNSTSEAAKWVSEHPEEPLAAVGTALAAKLYGLAVRVEAIQDYANNRTRFVVLGRPELGQLFLHHSRLRQVGNKTTLRVMLPEDYPGALHQVLSAFAWRKLNLSRIESRPTKKGLGSYYFFMDVMGSMDEVLMQGVVSEITALGCEVSVLGSYPCYEK